MKFCKTFCKTYSVLPVAAMLSVAVTLNVLIAGSLFASAYAGAEVSATSSNTSKMSRRAVIIDQILQEADSALASTRLLKPEHDNAYDRYRAVLSLDPNNVRAQAGLDNIVLAYGELIRKRLRANQIRSASLLLHTARTHWRNNAFLRQLQKEIEEARAKAHESVVDNSSDLTIKEFELPESAVSAKSESVKNFLKHLALRVQETDEAVIIESRSDAEGRWIYKMMREAVTDYRIRGDIHRASRPLVRLEAPL